MATLRNSLKFVVVFVLGLLLLNTVNTTGKHLFEEYIRDENHRVHSDDVEIMSESILEYSMQRGLDPVAVLAVIKVESDFDQWAKSKGNYGLMQVNRTVWLKNKRNENNLVKHGIVDKTWDLFHPHKNIDAGTFIMHLTRSYCKNWAKVGKLKMKGYENIAHCTIASYNGSKGKHHYYRKVLAAYKLFYEKYYNRIKLAELEKNINVASLITKNNEENYYNL